MASILHSSQPPADKHGGFMKPRRRSSYSAPVVFVFVVLGVIFVMSLLFRVSDIQVEGNTHYTDEEIINATGLETGDNIFFFDKFATISRAYTKLPYLEEVVVERQLPGTLTIRVTESKALAYLAVGDEEWTIDRSCKILGKAVEGETEQLIPIYGVQPGTLLIGERLARADGVEERVDYLSAVLGELQDRGLAEETEWVDFTDTEYVFFRYTDKYTVVIGKEAKLDHKFAMLMSVLEKLKSGDVGTIDLSNGDNVHFIPN
jgi:cell division protein FtsQ